MNLRVARHTNDLKAIIHFYHEIVGLEVLGSFKDHEGYDGVFLGLKDESWHLEFTVSGEAPRHTTDEDDLLVFYARTEKEYRLLIERIQSKGIQEVASRNPYWEENGITLLDPDGFRVVISMPKR